MLKTIALIFGIICVLLGLLGFVPGITSLDTNGRQLLLGVFLTDALHNALYLIAGVAALLAAGNTDWAKWCLVILGVVFSLIAFVGFFDTTVFGLLRVNTPDNWLHLALGIGMLGAGFGIHTPHSPSGTTAKKAA